MRVAIFASGSGTNAENIINYFRDNNNVDIAFIISNKQDAYVHERAKMLQIPSFYYPKSDFENNVVLNKLKEESIDFIVLAGFLLKVSENIIATYPNRIVNIHPALLPKYGGKGMYGMYVHQSVVENKDKQTGISIHYVNEHYDEGELIFQAFCDVLPTDTPTDVANKVHALEYEHFPRVLASLWNCKQ